MDAKCFVSETPKIGHARIWFFCPNRAGLESSCCESISLEILKYSISFKEWEAQNQTPENTFHPIPTIDFLNISHTFQYSIYVLPPFEIANTINCHFHTIDNMNLQKVLNWHLGSCDSNSISTLALKLLVLVEKWFLKWVYPCKWGNSVQMHQN